MHVAHVAGPRNDPGVEAELGAVMDGGAVPQAEQPVDPEDGLAYVVVPVELDVAHPTSGMPAPGRRALHGKTKQALTATGVGVDHDGGLDHGTWSVVRDMYPEANIPVLQLSIDYHQPPEYHYALAKELAALRRRGVLIIGSGFMTHGLPFLEDFRPEAAPPAWSKEFDLWTAETLANGDVDALVDYKRRAPGVRLAHPTVDHFVPLFVALGASLGKKETPDTVIDGYFLGLSKRSVQFE